MNIWNYINIVEKSPYSLGVLVKHYEDMTKY